MMDQIKVAFDSVAELYRSSSVEERRKLDLLASLRLRDVAESRRSLEDIVREISRNARRRGLTEEILRTRPRSK